MKRNKTVYILGAGFSIEAGAPSQEKLVSEIFEVNETDPDFFQAETINKFQKFLSETLLLKASQFNSVALEDIFTPLDKCLQENISFRNLTLKGVFETRELVYYLIGKTLQKLLYNSSKDYIDQFANEIVQKCSLRIAGNYRDIDSVSVLSANWDILLDNSIKDILDRDFYNRAVVDYCCHISSYNLDDETVKPGLEILGKGGFNAKLIKLHGSLNWLQCPRCSRVYVDFNNKIAINQYHLQETCRHCDRNYNKTDSNILTSNLIMPTYFKNLGNAQYRMIWKAAETEISEATKIVFIGYSLPFADFEMRQLLSRMTRNDTTIEVVDYGDPESEYIKGQIKKFETFFGSRKIDWYFKGASHYIYNNIEA